MKRDPSERQLQATLDVKIKDIYHALDEVGLSKSAANVDEVSNYIRTIAIDAASTALVDWIQQKRYASCQDAGMQPQSEVSL